MSIAGPDARETTYIYLGVGRVMETTPGRDVNIHYSPKFVNDPRYWLSCTVEHRKRLQIRLNSNDWKDLCEKVRTGSAEYGERHLKTMLDGLERTKTWYGGKITAGDGTTLRFSKKYFAIISAHLYELEGLYPTKSFSCV